MHEMNLFFIVFNRLIASAGNQCGTPVFFLADAPARYNAWDEFVLYSFYRLTRSLGYVGLCCSADAPGANCSSLHHCGGCVLSGVGIDQQV